MTSKAQYWLALINKDNSEKFFWTGKDFSHNEDDAWTAEQSQAEAAADKVRDAAEAKWGCPCPYDIIVEDTENNDWYIPGGGRLDA